jgi:hypothetical protein
MDQAVDANRRGECSNISKFGDCRRTAPIETADSRSDLRGFKTELLEFRVLIGDPRRGGFEDH